MRVAMAELSAPFIGPKVEGGGGSTDDHSRRRFWEAVRRRFAGDYWEATAPITERNVRRRCATQLGFAGGSASSATVRYGITTVGGSKAATCAR
jgi:hypothetical protein